MITFSVTIEPPKGGQTFKINVDNNGRPFGQLYWYGGATHIVHAKPLAGEPVCFRGCSALGDAKRHMRKLAGERV